MSALTSEVERLKEQLTTLQGVNEAHQKLTEHVEDMEKQHQLQVEEFTDRNAALNSAKVLTFRVVAQATYLTN